jgi:DNA-binding beta-propeller fold protein YncE
MNRKMWSAAALVVAGVLSAAAAGQAQHGEASKAAAPVFEVDPSWPAKLPNNWVTGVVSSISVDGRDHIWVLHRPRSVPADQKERAAPPVLEFDASGKFLRGWGGPAAGYEWPMNEHGIHVDYKNNVWIGGSGAKTDTVVLKFTDAGKFLLQIGKLNQSGGNNDNANLNRPADVFVYQKTNEVFVADGYGNHRVIVFDADTGAFKRKWGAFGNVPLDAPPVDRAGLDLAAETGPGPQQFGTTHAVKVSNDGLVYVGDRDNRRIQVFTPEGKYINQLFVNRAGPSAAGVGGIAFSPDAEQRFMYLADFGNSQLVIVNRKALEVVGRFGTRSSKPGEFQGVHFAATDSKGNLYTAEAAPGNRAQKFVFKGVS